MRTQLEICAASYESALNAMVGGADRIELCSALSVGGLTPSSGLINQVIRNLSVPAHILIRPREGNFTYTNDEKKIILYDINEAENQGAAGIVVGALTNENLIDVDFMHEISIRAKNMHCTFHRAFDLIENKTEGLEQLINLGFTRILTSGGYKKAWEGRFVVKELVQYASGRIEIMPGSGINVENLEELITITGSSSVHSSAMGSSHNKSNDIFPNYNGTDIHIVKKLKQIINSLETV